MLSRELLWVDKIHLMIVKIVSRSKMLAMVGSLNKTKNICEVILLLNLYTLATSSAYFAHYLYSQKYISLILQ